MASYGLNYRMVRCANCHHYILRGRKCRYCGDFDVSANLRETPLERLVSRVENSWKRSNRLLKLFLILLFLALVAGFFYIGFAGSQSVSRDIAQLSH